MEMSRGRVIFQALRKGIHQFPGRSHIPGQQVRGRQTAFHPPLPCHQHRRNPVIPREPGRIHHAAHIHHNHHMGKIFFDCFHHPLLCIRQIKVPSLKQLRRPFYKHTSLFRLERIIRHILRSNRAVPVFTGEAADRDNRRIRKCFRPLQKSGGNLRLCHHSRLMAFLVLPPRLLFIKRGQRFI